MDTVIAGVNPVSVDAFGATLFGIGAKDVPHVVYAHQLGLGEMDLRKIKIITVKLG